MCKELLRIHLIPVNDEVESWWYDYANIAINESDFHPGDFIINLGFFS